MSSSTIPSSLQPGATISGQYAVLSVTRRVSSTPDRRPFFTGDLRNRERTIKFIAGKSVSDFANARVGIDDLEALFATEQVVRVEGTLDQWNGEDQIAVNRVSAVPAAEVNPSDFMPVSDIPLEEWRTRFEAEICTLGVKWQCVVGQAIDSVTERFYRWPAALLYHHAWIGGLVEHTLEVAGIARDIAAPLQCVAAATLGPKLVEWALVARVSRWSTVDVDLLVAAALLHDIGKVDELAVGVVTSYTDLGRTLGHIQSGILRVNAACDDLALSDFDRQRLLHCLASHHGQPEFGSAVKPLTAEAIILHQADDLSAKMAMIASTLKNDPRGLREWSDKVPGLDRSIWSRAARQAHEFSIPERDFEPGDVPF